MLLQLEGEGPLYTRVYSTLRRHIVEGRFGSGERLPGTRSVAQALGVSRTVVLSAYSQLESEGYTCTRVGSGTYVLEQPVREDVAQEPVDVPDVDPPGMPPPEAPVSRLAARVPHTPARDQPLDLLDAEVGVVDLTAAAVHYDLRALKAWRRSLSQAMDALPAELTGDAGAAPVGEVMLEYLHRERGVVANVDDIVIVHSAQQARDLIARVLVDEHTIVAVEEPGEPGVRSAFRAAGGVVTGCDVDADGLDADRDRQLLESARVLHVSPACHQPTGAVMAAERRRELLAWAYARPAWIVEEDFDRVPRHGVRIMPALATDDRHERVIYYLNGLATGIYPGMQVSCVVVPPALREKFHALKEVSDRDGVALHHHAWARYVASGDYARSLRRLSKGLRHARGVVVAALQRHLGHAAKIVGDGATGQLLVHLPALDAGWWTVLREDALRMGLLLQSAARWYLHPPAHATLLLHYATASETALETGIERLARAYRRALHDVRAGAALRPA